MSITAERRRVLARLAALAAAVCALAVTAMAPAQAHSTSLPDVKYYRSTVTSISPVVEGLTVRLSQGGETVTLVNQTGQTVEVLGYTGEDYLRIGRDGVDENTNSLSAFLNGSLVISGLPQQMGASHEPPNWKHVGSGRQFSWHDHRVHWMAQQRPPAVAAGPEKPQKVFDWAIDLRVNDQPVVVHGTLTWVGKPRTNPIAYTLYGLGATCIVVLVVLIVRERRSRGAAGSRPDGLVGPSSPLPPMRSNASST